MLNDLEDDFPEHKPRPATAPKALDGIRVVDFTHFIAGPFATMMLADMGADVIKIEAPGRGDEFRYYPPAHPDESTLGAPYLWANRNKRSIALDLKSDTGRQIALELIATADIVAENFSTGVMNRLGLGYEDCKKVNPEVIYCAVSAYGREGKFSDRLGFDPIAQAESGFVSMNGYADREGVRALSPVMDISTAMMACNAMLGALVARQRTGRGQSVEVALFDNAVLMTGYATLQHIFTGDEPQRHGNTSPDTCPSGVFQASDTSFYINCGNNKIFHRLASQVLDMPELAADPVLADRNGRIARRAELFKVLGDAFIKHPWLYWQDRMRAASIPCGQVRKVGETLRSPEGRDRELVTRVPHAELGWLPNIRLPIKFSGTPVIDPVAAPLVGEHSHAILRDTLGYDADQIKALLDTGAVSARAPKATSPPAREETGCRTSAMSVRSLRGQVAVVGIGESAYYKVGQSPDPEFKLLLDAILAACADAALDPREIDGFASYANDRSEPTRLAASLGTRRLRSTTMQWGGGGGGCAAAVANGAAAIVAGLADCVLVYRGLAQGQFGRFSQAAPTATVSGDLAYLMPYGVLAPPQRFAMRVRRFMHEHNVKQDTLRAIALASNHHAQSNPRAVMYGKPLSTEQYDSSRYIAEPFRLYDCCMENDGAAALILVDAERAADFSSPSAYLLAAASGGEPRFSTSPHNSPNYASANTATVARDLFAMAKVAPGDVGSVQSYENFTGGVAMALAEHGFYPPDEANEFLSLERLLAPAGALPLNTSGGNLGECYVHGFELIVEAVRQVRGTSTCQAERHDVALVIGGPMVSPASSLLFGSQASL